MNKLRLLALASLISFTGMMDAKAANNVQKRSYGPQVATGTSSLATAQYTKPITPAQVNNTGGYQIKAPGYYFLTEDLHFYPKSFIDNSVRLPKPAAIYISVDNVVLDLNNKTLSHLDSKTLAQSITTGLYSGKALENDAGDSNDIAGIQIAPGVRNVTIKNGTLQYILGNGILVEPAASGGNSSNITVDNITVINCGNEGIKIGGSASQTFDVTISNTSVSQCSGTIQYGDLSAAADASSNLNGLGHAIGISLINVSNGVIANSSASNNQIDTSLATDASPVATLSDNTSYAMGIKLDTCDNLTVENSVFNNQIGPCAFGMHMTSCNNIYTKNLLANNNQIQPMLLSTGNNDTAGSCGDNTAAGVSMQDCEFCVFEDSIANNNQAYYRAASTTDEIVTSHGAGFMMTPKSASVSPYGVNNYNRFVRCQAHSNKGSRIPATGTTAYADDAGTITQANWVNVVYGAGFLSIGADSDSGATDVAGDDDHHSLAADSMNTGNVFSECRASGNWGVEGNYNQDSKACGIALLFENASTVKGCQLISNGITTASSKLMGAGLYMGPLGDAADETPADGFGEAHTRNCLVQDNWFVANSWYGLYDDATDCQSLIMSNFAFRNGALNGELQEGISSSNNNLNYKVTYSQSDENLPSASATIGDFGALTVAHAFANTDISVLATSTSTGDISHA